MAYKYTLADAKASGALKTISGVVPSSAQFVDLVNEAQRRLAKRGNFFGTTQTMKIVFQGSIVAWPREVSSVLGIRGFQRNIRNFNSWYSYTGEYKPSGCDPFDCTLTGEDLPPAPVTNQIFGDGAGMLIRYYVTSPSDIGKTITLYGKKAGYMPLQTNTDGVLSDGVTLTAGRPYVSTADRVTDIISIKRQATDGVAFLYQYNPTDDTLIDLAMFLPGDKVPSFRRTLLHGVPETTCNTSDPTAPVYNQVEALVKLDFIPVASDGDFLLVDDFDALKFMIQAIKAEEANDHQTAETLILKAIRELNFTDREKMPNWTTPVSVVTCAGMVRNPD